MNEKMKDIAGAWSATPTPLTHSLAVDTDSVQRMVDHHVCLKQKGLFIGGTCGEGPFLRRDEVRRLIAAVTEANAGRMLIAAQVTDNSYIRVLDNIAAAKADGADIAVVAEPWFSACCKEEVLLKYYLETAEKSELPIGVYSRGGKEIAPALYEKILQHPNVCMFKDSSVDDEIMAVALKAREENGNLKLMTGYELGMVPYLKAGYDGILAGGGILIGALCAEMVRAAAVGDFEQVEKLQAHCDLINYAAYGGKEIVSWLTGLKYALVKMGIFTTSACYLEFPLPPSVSGEIDTMIEREKDVLFPG